MEGGGSGLKSLPENGRKVARKHHNRAGRGCCHGVERRRREEERESVLKNCLVQMKLKQINTWLKIKHKKSAFANDN